MEQRHCKVICRRCGAQQDCSDLEPAARADEGNPLTSGTHEHDDGEGGRVERRAGIGVAA